MPVTKTQVLYDSTCGIYSSQIHRNRKYWCLINKVLERGRKRKLFNEYRVSDLKEENILVAQQCDHI